MNPYIYQLLKEKYGTQEAIAAALGVDRTFLSKVKNGAAKLPKKLLQKAYDLVGGLSSNTVGIPDNFVTYRVVGVAAEKGEAA